MSACGIVFVLFIFLNVTISAAREVEVYGNETMLEYLCPSNGTILPHTKLIIFEPNLYLNTESQYCLLENSTDISILPSKELENDQHNTISVTCNNTMLAFFNITNLTIKSVNFIGCINIIPPIVVKYINESEVLYYDEQLQISLFFNHCNNVTLFNVLVISERYWAIDFGIIGTNLCGYSNISTVMPYIHTDLTVLVSYIDSRLTTENSKCVLNVESNMYMMNVPSSTGFSSNYEYYLRNFKPNMIPVSLMNQVHFSLLVTQQQFNVTVDINILPLYQDNIQDYTLPGMVGTIFFINSITQSKVKFRGYSDTICTDKSSDLVPMFLDVIFYETPSCNVCSNHVMTQPLEIYNTSFTWSSYHGAPWLIINSFLRIIQFFGRLSHQLKLDNITWCECKIDPEYNPLLEYLLYTENLISEDQGDLFIQMSNVRMENNVRYYQFENKNTRKSLVNFSNIDIVLDGVSYFRNNLAYLESLILINVLSSNLSLSGNLTIRNEANGFGGGCLKLDNSSTLFLMEPLRATFSNKFFSSAVGTVIYVPIHEQSAVSGIQVVPNRLYSIENITNINISLYFRNDLGAKSTSLYAPQFSFAGTQLSDKFLFEADTWDKERHQYAYTTLIDSILKNMTLVDKYNSLSNGICTQLHGQLPWTCRYVDEVYMHTHSHHETVTYTYPGGVVLATVDSFGKKHLDVEYSDVNLHCLHTTEIMNNSIISFQTYFCNDSYVTNTLLLQLIFSNHDINVSIPLINVTLLPTCPKGFILQNDNCICYCDCLYPLKAHHYVCDTNKFRISNPANTWTGVSYKGGGDAYDILISNVCPPKLCDLTFETFSLSNNSISDLSCHSNHTGVLCGECKKNYSVVFGSDTCYSHCTNMYLLTLPMYALAGLVLVLVLFVLRLTIATGTINGVIFYANVLGLVMDRLIEHKDGTYTTVLHVIISLLNLNLGFPLCFYEGMTTEAKVGFQFVFPTYLWGIVVAMIVISKFSVRFSNVVSKSSVQVLATLFYLSFSKLLSTVINIISFSKLYVVHSSPVSESEYTVWYYNGALAYGHSVHGLLLVVALGFTVLFLLPYAILVTFSSCFVRFHVVNRFKPFIDAYGGPFKEKWRFWFGLRLWITIFIFLAEGIFRSTKTVFIIHIVVVQVFILLQVLCRPFKNSLIGVVDTFLMVNYWLIIEFYLVELPFFLTSFLFLVSVMVFISFLVVIFHCIKCPNVKRKKYKIYEALDVTGEEEDLFKAARAREQTIY